MVWLLRRREASGGWRGRKVSVVVTAASWDRKVGSVRRRVGVDGSRVVIVVVVVVAGNVGLGQAIRKSNIGTKNWVGTLVLRRLVRRRDSDTAVVVLA